MIWNKTKKEYISTSEIVCRDIFSQMRGLMFHRKKNALLIFPEERYIYLHTCFVFFPIDVLVINEQQKIVEIKYNLRPFQFWNSKQKGLFIVELASPSSYELGDKVQTKL